MTYKLLQPILAAVRVAEQFLGPEDDWVEDDRRIVYEAADRFLRPLGRPTVRQKGPADYVTTVDADSDSVEDALDNAGYQRNLLSTRKYRTHHDGGKQWAVGSYVHPTAETKWQHHVYLFETADGRTDVYAHREPSAEHAPKAHVSGEQTHGDPNGRVRDALTAYGLDYSEREL